MATSSPLRLDEKLVVAAAARGSLEKRTTPRQIEYWAELGRAIERDLDAQTLLAVREGLARIRVEPVSSQPVASEDVFAALELAQSSGRLSREVSAAAIRYQASRSMPGLLEQIQADGKVVTGRFENGRFIPQTS
ncbi:MAG: hypothetical protein CVV16_04070 [Gammaproteobacteria bacterium HGW-Gammaproteobacteria-6]|nr:MAG: hypothetical protein CVV16_04070 [Gammaproteobacteria bacterium HGW-Gammaproteobacteria-6]